MNISPEPSGIIDPNQVGPSHVCFRCFTPHSDSYAFCENCGRIMGFLETPFETHGEHCFVHTAVPASTYCVLCGRPICKECNQREGMSFISGLPTPQCRTCLDNCSRLEANVLNEVRRSQSCAKHKDRQGTFTCVTCSLPHCSECSYFITGGLFRLRIKAGPYCLGCFRTVYIGRSRKHWISGARALTAGLISQ